MTQTVQSLTIKTPDQIRDDYLRTYSNALIVRGVAAPNTSKGTEIWVRASALAQQIYMASANVPVVANAQMGDTAQGDDLVRCAATVGLALRAAGPSAGSMVLASTVPVAIGIVSGSQLLDPAGLRYEVSVSGQYSNGAPIPISAIDTGTATNLAAGVLLRWVSPPPYCQPNASVASPGLAGGTDLETIEELRTRYLERLQNPSNGTNWASANAAAEGSSTAAQKSFTYCAANGPSTMHVAVAGAPTATSKSRVVSAVTLAQTITPALVAQFPEFAEIIVTPTVDYPVSVAFGLAIPASTAASPPGPGGGWIDGNPFPTASTSAPGAGGGTGYVTPLATTSTVLTLLSDYAPAQGFTVCWLSPHDWKLYTSTVQSFAGTGPYTVTLGAPLVDSLGFSVSTQDYVFPGATNMATYVAAALAGFAAMGPGEKVAASGGLWPRAGRRPIPAQSWPSTLTAPFLRCLLNAGQEVAGANYLYSSAATPPLPALITQGPNIFIPQHLGFYPQ